MRKYIIILLMMLLLVSSSFAFFCYQESANVSNQTGIDGDCNLTYTGSYLTSPNGTDPGIMYINYTLPTTNLSISPIWQVKINSTNESNVTQDLNTLNNLTLPSSCLTDPLQLKVESRTPSPIGQMTYSAAYCYNSSDWIQLLLYNGSNFGGSNFVATGGESLLYDGNWSNYASYIINSVNDWAYPNPGGWVSVQSRIWEEAIWWDFTNVVFSNPTPTNGSNVVNYGLVFNITTANNSDFGATGNFIQIDGVNNTCSVSADLKSCNYTLPYSEHLFNHTYSLIGHGNISGIYNSTIERLFDYNGCGNANSNDISYNLTSSISGLASTTCLNITGNNVTFNGNGFNISTSGSVSGVVMNLTNSDFENVSIINDNLATFSGICLNVVGGNLTTVRNITTIYNNTGGGSSLIELSSDSNSNIYENITSTGTNGILPFRSASSNNNITNLTTSSSGSTVFVDTSSNNNIYTQLSTTSTSGGSCGLLNGSNSIFTNWTAYCNTGNGIILQGVNNYTFTNLNVTGSSIALSFSNNRVVTNTNISLLAISGKIQAVGTDATQNLSISLPYSDFTTHLNIDSSGAFEFILNNTFVPVVDLDANINESSYFSYSGMTTPSSITRMALYYTDKGSNYPEDRTRLFSSGASWILNSDGGILNITDNSYLINTSALSATNSLGLFTGILGTEIVSLDTPADLYTTTDTGVNFNFTQVSSISTNSSCSLYIDSVLSSTNSTTQNNTLTTLSATLAVGSHTWYINCTDLGQNNNVSGTRNIGIATSGGGGGSPTPPAPPPSPPSTPAIGSASGGGGGGTGIVALFGQITSNPTTPVISNTIAASYPASVTATYTQCGVRKTGPIEIFSCEYEGLLGLVFFDSISFGIVVALVLFALFVLLIYGSSVSKHSGTRLTFAGIAGIVGFITIISVVLVLANNALLVFITRLLFGGAA